MHIEVCITYIKIPWLINVLNLDTIHLILMQLGRGCVNAILNGVYKTTCCVIGIEEKIYMYISTIYTNL